MYRLSMVVAMRRRSSLFALVLTTSVAAAFPAGCGFGGAGSVEESLTKTLDDRRANTASVACEASDALPYIQDFMKQAEAADTCDVDFTDGSAGRYCVVSDGSGGLLMVTPNRTCEQTAAEYGRGPGMLAPGELEEQLESANSN